MRVHAFLPAAPRAAPLRRARYHPVCSLHPDPVDPLPSPSPPTRRATPSLTLLIAALLSAPFTPPVHSRLPPGARRVLPFVATGAALFTVTNRLRARRTNVHDAVTVVSSARPAMQSTPSSLNEDDLQSPLSQDEPKPPTFKTASSISDKTDVSPFAPAFSASRAEWDHGPTASSVTPPTPSSPPPSPPRSPPTSESQSRPLVTPPPHTTRTSRPSSPPSPPSSPPSPPQSLDYESPWSSSPSPSRASNPPRSGAAILRDAATRLPLMLVRDVAVPVVEVSAAAWADLRAEIVLTLSGQRGIFLTPFEEQALGLPAWGELEGATICSNGDDVDEVDYDNRSSTGFDDASWMSDVDEDSLSKEERQILLVQRAMDDARRGVEGGVRRLVDWIF